MLTPGATLFRASGAALVVRNPPPLAAAALQQLQLENLAQAVFDGIEVSGRNSAEPPPQSLFGDRSNLVYYRDDELTCTINWDENGRAWLRGSGERNDYYGSAPLVNYIGRQHQAWPGLLNF